MGVGRVTAATGSETSTVPVRQSVLVDERFSEPVTTSLISATLATSLLGGTLLLVAELVSLPAALVGVGVVLFVVGLALALVVGFLDARREGHNLLRSLGHGFRTLWSWLWAVMP